MTNPPLSSQEILTHLHRVEEEQDFEVIFAVLGGSYGWGYDTEGSDMDVRFVYRRSLNHYLSIDVENRRDVYEKEVSPTLELTGFDLRKALHLMNGSNPNLLWWLEAEPWHTYVEHKRLRRLGRRFFGGKAMCWQSLSMAKNCFNRYVKGEETPQPKKLFHPARGVLTCRYILRKGQMPPKDFWELVLLTASKEVDKAVTRLFELREGGVEAAEFPVLQPWLSEEISFLYDRGFGDVENDTPGTEELNRFYRQEIVA